MKAPKVGKYLGYFCTKNVEKTFQKIPPSGHTNPTTLNFFEAMAIRETTSSSLQNVFDRRNYCTTNHLGIILSLVLGQCDQKKSPNVYESCPNLISIEKL